MNRSPAPPRPFFRWNFQFTLGGLLILMLVASIAVSGGSYLWAAIRGEQTSMLVFFPFVLIVPYATTIALFWLRQLLLGRHDSDKRYLG